MLVNESVPIGVAVITPVFGHSGLVMDALASVRALRNTSRLTIHHVLVNDGCPDAATPAICVPHALECPKRTHYIWQTNAGLSAARNKGIDFALNELANIQAIFFLDADNTLRNGSIDRAFSILEENPSTSWVYPSIDMFGHAWNGDFGGDYSLLIHTHLNICEAGSLVHRRVFDSGLRFDEEFRSGLEDWEFYLHAALRGFRGKYYREFGFRYRKRPESMLADSSRKMKSVLDQLRAKHAVAFSPRSRAEFEHFERPRYLHLHRFSEPCFSSMAVPSDCSGLSFDDLKLSFDNWRHDKRTNHFPPFVLATTVTESTWSTIAALLPGLIWRLEQHLSKSALDLVTVCFKESALDVSIDSVDGDFAGTPHLYFFRSTSLLDEDFCRMTIPLLGLCGEPSHGGTKQKNYVVSIPGGISPEDARHCRGKADRLAEFISVAARHSEPIDFCWRSDGIANFNQPELFLRHSFGGHEAFPFQPPTRASRSIGFLLPLFDFGGVEKVALNIASTLADEGWEVHLFVAHKKPASLSRSSFSVFSSITFLGIDEAAVQAGGDTSYFGTATDFAVGAQVLERIVSAMYWLNSLINFHCPWAGQAMNRLRSLGVRVFASLHVSDLTPTGRPVGNPYSALAFEHTYNYIITCSKSLYSWCLGMGFPEGKLILVQNSFGYNSNSEAALASKVVDVHISDTNPLNVLYLGRFDHQKGMDRVQQIFFGSRSSRLPLNWKIVGKRLLPTAIPINNEFRADFTESILDPVYESDALDALYQWAHVIIIPSRYEGLPLVLLEAMRFGVVPISTAVGAIEEVLENGVNGYMFGQDEFVTSALRKIELLCEEPDVLGKLSASAVRTVKELSWKRSCQALIGALNAG